VEYVLVGWWGVVLVWGDERFLMDDGSLGIDCMALRRWEIP
jgi:hypothetical protein